MSRPQRFIFEKYSLDKDRNFIHFFYSYDNGQEFQETIDLRNLKVNWSQVNRRILNKVIFNLHLVLGLSYYKLYCPPRISIKSGSLNRSEADFWNKLYTKGLGELFYRNRIDYRGLIKFPFENKVRQPQHLRLKDRCLLANGGGKDSIVAAERLKELDKEFSIISLNDSDIQTATSRLIGGERLIIKRQIDPRAIKLADSYRGHIPISSIYAWFATLTAVLKNYKYLVFSNEASANFGNTRYLGQIINHQYSKTLEFENDFRGYLHYSISPDIEYFSLLRHLSELKIVEKFSHYPAYFSAFSSCNRNFSQTRPLLGRWCGQCPKCAFMFSQLAAFADKKTLIEIFGRNLLADKKLLPLFQELWGEKRFKPFDCVGTPTEVKSALLLADRHSDWSKDAIMAYFNSKIKTKIKNHDALIQKSLKMENGTDNIPENFKKILILGYGLEGHFTYEYLRKKYPDLKLWIADQKMLTVKDKKTIVRTGANYLAGLADYDLIIKSPGLSPYAPEIVVARRDGIKFDSVTNLFLAVKGQQTIGVTGTKGKSTTASLIYSSLKAGGREAYLVGNIGHDPLKYLAKKTGSKAIFVYELSSYQLATGEYSPHIAVFIDLFPDHLPYHHGFTNYARDKAKIVARQTKADYFVFNARFPQIKNLRRQNPASALDYLALTKIKGGWLYYQEEKIIPLKEINLLGEHNLENIRAAICVAKLYKIKNSDLRRALAKFTNLEHRLEYVGEFRGIKFYDDAISTTPESTLAALKTFAGRIDTLILGGEDRGYDFSKLAEEIMNQKIKNLVFFPDSGAKIEKVLARLNQNKQIFQILKTDNMEMAVRFAYRQTVPGRICLLSTASPSYSIFRNFQDKGDRFQAAIKKYAAKL